MIDEDGKKKKADRTSNYWNDRDRKKRNPKENGQIAEKKGKTWNSTETRKSHMPEYGEIDG